jgi:hypothetical protein
VQRIVLSSQICGATDAALKGFRLQDVVKGINHFDGGRRLRITRGRSFVYRGFTEERQENWGKFAAVVPWETVNDLVHAAVMFR